MIKEEVKKAKSISDDSVLYGETSKREMWLIGISGFLLMVFMVMGSISFYELLN